MLDALVAEARLRWGLDLAAGLQVVAAERLIAGLNAEKVWPRPIVTEVAALPQFYPAEDYHQEYWEGEGQRNPYCLAVIPPKLMKLRKSFAAKARAQASPMPALAPVMNTTESLSLVMRGVLNVLVALRRQCFCWASLRARW